MSAIRITHTKPLVLAATPLQEKNFGLTEAEFQDLREALIEGDQRLFERVFLAHFDDCVCYLKSKDGASHEEAYDTTMDCLLHFRKLLVSRKIDYGNLRYLLTRMTRQQLHRKRKRTSTALSWTDQELDIPIPPNIFSNEEYTLLSRAFQSLGQDCQELLQAFYYQKRSLKELAEEVNISAVALRKRKSRCVATLRKYFHHIS